MNGTKQSAIWMFAFRYARFSRRAVLSFLIVLFASWRAHGQSETPAPADEQPSLMQILSEHGKHNLEDESWNAYLQFTYISVWKAGFPAPYTNANGSTNSLLPTAENSFTGSATLYVGARLWKNGEAYIVPELLSERPFSQARGLGGAIPDFEVEKGGSETPKLYLSRVYLKQTFGFGGQKVVKESGQQQLRKQYDSRRLVLVLGNFSVLDFFDRNAFDIDPRQGFFNLGFVTYTAYDFGANARGYTWGALSEFYWDHWAIRFGRIAPPKNPNQLPIDFRLLRYYGDQLELEHHHRFRGQDGQLRVLAYRNRENIARFSDAVAAFEADPEKNATTCTGFNYGSNNAGAPDLCWARKPNVKIGAGVFGEQYVARDMGVFSRAMISDGKTEVDSYTSADRSFSLGALAKGSAWARPRDLAGLGVNLNWISKSHVDYLRLGGIDGFIGDGRINPGAESAVEVFYSFNFRKSFWLSGDYQHVANPAFNADRGPVNFFGLRVHGEF